MNKVKANYEHIKALLPENVKLVVASKKKSPELIKEAYECGLRCFGENYVQELVRKYESSLLKDLNIEWHFIGSLQRNKVKYIIDKVSLIQSVSSMALSDEINRRAENVSKVQDILVEINIGNEENKGGVRLKDLDKLLSHIKSLPQINLRGFMIIPPNMGDTQRVGLYFKQTKEIFDKIPGLDILSMGMSGDFLEAIKYGSNMVRIGTKILGER